MFRHLIWSLFTKNWSFLLNNYYMFKRKRWKTEEIEKMFKLKQYNYSTKSIAKYFGVTIYSIYKQVKKHILYLCKFRYLNKYLNDRKTFECNVYYINNLRTLYKQSRLNLSEIEYINRFFIRKNINVDIV